MNILEKLFGLRLKSTPEPNHPEVSILQANDLEERMKKTMELLDGYKRRAYLPITSENQNTFSDQSKIGGYPYIRNEDDWPKCPNCHKHMQLFLQLNLEQIPESKDKGLIQLFYCTTTQPHCETELKAYFPFSKAVVCRKIEVNGSSVNTKPDIGLLFHEKQIIDWEQKDDYPHPEEYEQLGIEVEDDVLELMESRGIGLTIEKDKLFGWPFWVQSVEYPSDRQTNAPMELLFQLDSEDNLPFMFGDSGVGYLTQSPVNKEELAFGWACY